MHDPRWIATVKAVWPFSMLQGRRRSSTASSELIRRFDAALQWTVENSAPLAGIRVHTDSTELYPEVTGYFIPTLLNWGEHARAIEFARWLISKQNPDGSWSDASGRSPYTFDTGQILKGLLSIAQRIPEVDDAIRRGCDWILGQIAPTGRITTPDKTAWALQNGRTISERIHLYVLEALRDSGKRFGDPRYEKAVEQATHYYLEDPSLTQFDTLSHFHAYVLEALVDLGYRDLAAQGMLEIARLQRADGSVPAYANVPWVCSTGLAQYAVVWYKLGDRYHGDKAFRYLCRLQNRSGGFYGSYGRRANYFQDKEISWAVKYFLDAYYWHVRATFDSEASMFPESIADSDGRLGAVLESMGDMAGLRVLDAGCGKGRISRVLAARYPTAELWGVDLSDAMLRFAPTTLHTRQGSLLNLPFDEGHFDRVFSVEALEHSVNPKAAIRELCRVVKPGGRIAIVDKNAHRRGAFKIEAWERWFESGEVADWLRSSCRDVCSKYIGYEDRHDPDGLFIVWSGIRQ